MRIVETAWLAQPHPDLADAYAHVKLGDSARQRLVRVETLAAKTPGHIEGALAIARAAIDATEFAKRARGAGAVHRRADATRGDADGGDRAHRTWRQRPGAGLDLARGARAARSGLDRGRLCQRSLAAGVAGDRPARRLSVADAGRGAAVRQERRDRILAVRGSHAGAPAPRREPPHGESNGRASRPAPCAERPAPAGRRRTMHRRRWPPRTGPRRGARRASSAAVPPPRRSAAAGRPPLFRARQDMPKATPRQHSGRDPDHPGARRSRDRRRRARGRIRGTNRPAQAQAGGWRGFLSRWGS